MSKHLHSHGCTGTRRQFLLDTGMGFTGLALSAMMFRDGVAVAAPAQDVLTKWQTGEAKAKSVIWIFMIGGVSHMESFDPKPELTKYAEKSIDETPYREVADQGKINKILAEPGKEKREVFKKIFPLISGFKKYGQSGIEVSDLFPHIGGVIDDIALLRGMWTIDNNHGAQLTFHTGRKIGDTGHPTVGAWASYGLGTLNANLPEFVVLGEPSADCCGRSFTYGSAYLGPEYGGVRLKVDAKDPLSYVHPADPKLTLAEQRDAFSLIGQLNQISGIDYPTDDELRARIKAYELAFQMQMAVPELMDFAKESEHTKQLYGIDRKETAAFGSQCLAARRLVEQGVRFVQLFHGYSGNAGRWDHHANIGKLMPPLCLEIDQPIAGLISDLKQRGMLDETLVVFGTEFGRTPGAEFRESSKGTGRDHHPHGFTCWMAGGGVKGGMVHGATDELGFHAIEGRHYVTDIHATVLNQLGLNHYIMHPNRQRLPRDFGDVITEVIA
ncbi:MAG: DUF1501 domain-containing protein [Verrucomicrobiaceae bacterium]|nr:DUF1501 domain-containing protein [Verrucomicrobiaceae bacterium]